MAHKNMWISKKGKDSNNGTKKHPVKTMEAVFAIIDEDHKKKKDIYKQIML